MPPALIWIIIIILVLFGAFFSASETSMTSANRIRLKVQADEGSKGAALAVRLIDQFPKAMVTTVVGINIVTVFISSLATFLFVQLFGEGLGSLIATITGTLIVYLFCDTFPKAFARSMPNEMIIVTAYILRFFFIFLFPLVFIFQGVSWILKKVIKVGEEPALTDEDFTNILEVAEEKGHIDETNNDLIQSAMDFSETAVKDVFTPREKIFGLNLTGATTESINKTLLETNFSRLPVYRDDLDHIIGIIHIRTYFKLLKNNPNLDISTVVVKPYFVSIKVTIDELYEGFCKYKTHIAIVTDKNDKVVGMVTMEDALEEIVGKINESLPKNGDVKHVG
jgi:CBS domain containing-hemolysin-like protein